MSSLSPCSPVLTFDFTCPLEHFTIFHIDSLVKNYWSNFKLIFNSLCYRSCKFLPSCSPILTLDFTCDRDLFYHSLFYSFVSLTVLLCWSNFNLFLLFFCFRSWRPWTMANLSQLPSTLTLNLVSVAIDTMLDGRIRTMERQSQSVSTPQ